jgi:hypothetical protein
MVLTSDMDGMKTLLRNHKLPAEVMSLPVSPSDIAAFLVMSHSSFDDEWISPF